MLKSDGGRETTWLGQSLDHSEWPQPDRQLMPLSQCVYFRDEGILLICFKEKEVDWALAVAG